MTLRIVLLFLSFLAWNREARGADPRPTSGDAASQIAALEKRIASLEKRRLICEAGPEVRGEMDRWSPYSRCKAPTAVTGLQRIDIIADHNNPIVHVNDFQCTDAGCRAWCIGGPCTVQARCCSWADEKP